MEFKPLDTISIHHDVDTLKSTVDSSTSTVASFTKRSMLPCIDLLECFFFSHCYLKPEGISWISSGSMAISCGFFLVIPQVWPWIAGPWTSDPGALGGALGPAHGPWSLACALDAPVAALGGGWGGEDFPMGIPHG